MDLETTQDKKINKAVTKLTFELTYLPGILEEDDSYKAVHERLGVTAYGSTQVEAIENAKNQAKAELMSQFKLVEELLKL